MCDLEIKHKGILLLLFSFLHTNECNVFFTRRMQHTFIQFLGLVVGQGAFQELYAF
jgi:hypothetical protein